ncbi:MAG: LLM class flavin-dependent oxidoreductase [Betaproteobacteria bacterium]
MLKRLSVLDQSTAVAGKSHTTTIQETVDLAIQCELLGYERFWVSEHHSHPSIVGTAPEIMMAAIASKTKNIRVGSAGVMLPHYSAFKVAEQFRVLDALAPGRIDLGVGRAPGSDQRTARILNLDMGAAERFPYQVQELNLWLRDLPLPDGHPGKGVHAYPASETTPNIWVLGSSDYGAQVAALLGMPYAFAHFITDGIGAKEAIDLYKNNFKPSEWLKEPQAIACVWALAAKTVEEAEFHFLSRARWKLDRQKNAQGPILSSKDALLDLVPQEIQFIDQMKKKAFIGNGKDVAQQMRTLAENLGIEEIAIITWAADYQVRLDSYALISQNFYQKQESTL